jgi:hypothetical protein
MSGNVFRVSIADALNVHQVDGFAASYFQAGVVGAVSKGQRVFKASHSSQTRLKTDPSSFLCQLSNTFATLALKSEGLIFDKSNSYAMGFDYLLWLFEICNCKPSPFRDLNGKALPLSTLIGMLCGSYIH